MICTKCLNEGVKNEVAGKPFFYCRTCRDEIFVPKGSIIEDAANEVLAVAKELVGRENVVFAPTTIQKRTGLQGIRDAAIAAANKPTGITSGEALKYINDAMLSGFEAWLPTVEETERLYKCNCGDGTAKTCFSPNHRNEPVVVTESWIKVGEKFEYRTPWMNLAPMKKEINRLQVVIAENMAAMAPPRIQIKHNEFDQIDVASLDYEQIFEFDNIIEMILDEQASRELHGLPFENLFLSPKHFQELETALENQSSAKNALGMRLVRVGNTKVQPTRFLPTDQMAWANDGDSQ